MTAKLSIAEAKAAGFTLLLRQPAIWKWLQQLVRPVAWTNWSSMRDLAADVPALLSAAVQAQDSSLDGATYISFLSVLLWHKTVQISGPVLELCPRRQVEKVD